MSCSLQICHHQFEQVEKAASKISALGIAYLKIFQTYIKILFIFQNILKLCCLKDLFKTLSSWMTALRWPITAWKVSIYGVISGPSFPVLGLNKGKYGQEITPYLNTYKMSKCYTYKISLNIHHNIFSFSLSNGRQGYWWWRWW